VKELSLFGSALRDDFGPDSDVDWLVVFDATADWSLWHLVVIRQDFARVVNATFQARSPRIWGEGTTACASDSKKYGAWDQNLMTEGHVRYGGRGVMIYWHVERKSICIHSQLKTCSSSDGIIRKIPKTQRYLVTPRGRLLCTALTATRATSIDLLLAQTSPASESASPTLQHLPASPSVASSEFVAPCEADRE
jgi:hypothetical protein